jgi:subtilase family serine protease
MATSDTLLRWRIPLTLLVCAISIFAFLRRPDTTPVDFAVELRLSSTSVSPGQVVVPELELRNAGTNAARHRETTIRLYINGERWLEEPLHLPEPGRTETLTRGAGWSAPAPGSYEFRLVVDEARRLNDTNRGNNTATQTVTVKAPGS